MCGAGWVFAHPWTWAGSAWGQLQYHQIHGVCSSVARITCPLLNEHQFLAQECWPTRVSVYLPIGIPVSVSTSSVSSFLFSAAIPLYLNCLFFTSS